MLRRLLLPLTGMVLVLCFGLTALFAAPKAKVPPFTVSADSLDLNTENNHLVYEGNVEFRAPNTYATVIKCGRLEADAAAANKVQTVTASGRVAITMMVEMAAKGKDGKTVNTPYLVTGKGAQAVYDLGKQEVVLKGDDGTRPSFTAVAQVKNEAGDADTLSMSAERIAFYPQAMGLAGDPNTALPVTMVVATNGVEVTGAMARLQRDTNGVQQDPPVMKPVRTDVVASAAKMVVRLQATERKGDGLPRYDRVIELNPKDEVTTKARITMQQTDLTTKEQDDPYKLEGRPIYFNLETGHLQSGEVVSNHGKPEVGGGQ